MSYTVTSIRITSTFFVVVTAPRSEASLSVILHSKKIGDVIQFLSELNRLMAAFPQTLRMIKSAVICQLLKCPLKRHS